MPTIYNSNCGFVINSKFSTFTKVKCLTRKFRHLKSATTVIPNVGLNSTHFEKERKRKTMLKIRKLTTDFQNDKKH